ncbi:ATP-binding cassette domain-containing protein [Zhihengliuella sp.]|uniref:ABC transporter ATP-binding protein n=1 Tax=Zhihengliuella sp. TaxID=1954483 RepID=UPI00281204B6|nr:ATP-binding cassette domain-containing protein [Zhihengliuella sp.]
MSNIVVTGAAKSFGRRAILNGLDLDAPAGQMTALTGRSGSGKSTLLNCIGLMEKLDRGSIEVGGRDISRFGPERRRRFRRDSLGYMFQNYALIENASVRENLEVALAARGSAALATADFDGALDRVGLAGRGREPVYTLSGGEQQRVALARLIVKRPAVVLADEPTGALDRGNTAMVLRELERIASEGAAVVVATHSRDVAHACAAVVSLS